MAALVLPWLLVVPVAGLVAIAALRAHPAIQAWITVVMSALCLTLSVALWGAPDQPYMAGGHALPYGIPLRADGLSRVMLSLSGLVFTIASLYHLGQTRQGAKTTANPYYHLTFPMLLLGLNGAFLAADCFNFYVFFELVAVSSYLLVSLGKHLPLEAAWKYSIQSVAGSICLLIGVALLYGETGALAMSEVAARLTGPAYWVMPFFLVAFLLKGAIFPFHFWQPDAHAAATTAGSTLLAGLLIKLGMYGVLRFWPLLMGAAPRDLLVWLGAASIGFGAWAAFRQADAKRLLGFSSVSQLGFVLLAFGLGDAGAALFFLVSHSLAKAALFLATGAITDRAGTTRLAELEGAGTGLPWASAAYMVGMVSLVGLPPTAGFLAKLGVVQAGAATAAWGWVAIAAVGSLMTLGYLGPAYQRLFWGEPRPLPGRAHRPGLAATVTTACLVLALGLAGGPLWAACQASAAGGSP